LLQTDELARGNQIVAANLAKIRVVKDQIGELRALLNQVDLREAGNPTRL
jgi:hypothetical protein